MDAHANYEKDYVSIVERRVTSGPIALKITEVVKGVADVRQGLSCQEDEVAAEITVIGGDQTELCTNATLGRGADRAQVDAAMAILLAKEAIIEKSVGDSTVRLLGQDHHRQDVGVKIGTNECDDD